MRWLAHLLTGLQGLLLLGAYLLQRLSQTSMGVARHLIYLSGKWRAAVPWELLLVAVLLLAAACALWRWLALRRQGAGPRGYRPWLVALLLALLTLVFGLVFAGSGLRAYDQILAIFVLILVVQCGKGFLLARI